MQHYFSADRLQLMPIFYIGRVPRLVLCKGVEQQSAKLALDDIGIYVKAVRRIYTDVGGEVAW